MYVPWLFSGRRGLSLVQGSKGHSGGMLQERSAWLTTGARLTVDLRHFPGRPTDRCGVADQLAKVWGWSGPGILLI